MNEEKIRKFFEKKVIDSGHTFEGSVNKTLNKLGFSVKSEEFYYDKDEKKGRNIDFLAIDSVPSFEQMIKKPNKKIQIYGQIRFIIECKSLPNHGWIFFGNEEHESDFAYNSKFSSEHIEDVVYDLVDDIPEPEIYFASTYSEYILANGKQPKGKKSNYTKDNNLYESIVSLIKATSSNIEHLRSLEKLTLFKENTDILGVVFFQPVVVFNGHMYRTTNDKTNDIHLTAIDMVKIRRQYVSPNYNIRSGTIHVVSANKLEEYFKIMRKYYWANNFMVTSQKKLVNAHKNSLKQ